MPKNYGRLDIYHTINSFLFVFTYNSSTNITQDQISLEPKWSIYGSILPKASNQLSNLFLIYQTAISSIELKILNCFQSYDGNGFNCFMIFITNSIDFKTTIKVTFLSNGRITETKKETNFDTNNIDDILVLGLESGGFVIATVKYDNDTTGCNVIGYFLNNAITNEVHLDYPCSIVVTKNNTALTVPEKKPKYWNFLAIDIP